MMRYNNLKQRPSHFLSFTGLTVAEFDNLVQDNRQDWQDRRTERLLKNNPKRKRKIGGGRKFILNTFEDQLLLTLILTKRYYSCLLLEYLFSQNPVSHHQTRVDRQYRQISSGTATRL